MTFKFKKSPAYVAGDGYAFRGQNGSYGIKSVPSGISAIDPAALPGKKLWLRADVGVTLNGSGNVSAWADQSGEGNNMTNLYTVYYNPSDPLLNNQPSVVLSDTGGGWMEKSGSPHTLPGGSAARTTYTVAYRDVMSGDPYSDAGWRIIWGYGNYNAPNLGSYDLIVINSVTATTSATIDYKGYTGGGFTVTQNVPFIVSHSYVGSSTVESNETKLNNAVPTYTFPKGLYPGGGGGGILDTYTSSPTYLNIGCVPALGFASRHSGGVAEIIVFDVAHDEATMSGVNQYLANKYGITI